MPEPKHTEARQRGRAGAASRYVHAAVGLREKVRGEVIDAKHPRYEQARALYNRMIDKRPRLIVRCSDAADVMAAVSIGREWDLLTAIRGGGHSGPGLGSCDGGMVIDLSSLRGVRVDSKSRRAQVAGGCVWGDVDHATHAFGLATVSGIISSTGVGGLTLGGGHGYLTRKYGLTVDNLISADVVLADGRHVTASHHENEDLFWAIRGGGGNFGVLTSLELRLHPVDQVVGGPMLWPLDKAPDMMRWYDAFIAQAPEDVYGFFAFMGVPPAPPFPEELHGQTVCAIVWCLTDAVQEADDVLGPARGVHQPVFEHVGTVPFVALQSAFDAIYPPGLQWYWRGDFVRELPEEAIAQHLSYASRMPTPLSTMHLYPIDGAVHRAAPDETAFRFRDARWSQVIVGVSSDSADAHAITEWTRDYWKAIHPTTAGGAYVNFMMQEGQSRVRATYGDNYPRLVEVKKKYDPDNFFRINQNIPPADEETARH